MAGKRAFRPSAWFELESRVALSQLGTVSAIIQPLQGAGHHRGAGAHHVGRPHPGKAPLKKVGINAHHGLTALATTSLPTVSPTALNLPPTTAPIQVPPVTPPAVQAPPVVVPSTSGTMSAVEQAIVDLTNQQRQQAGLPPLQVNVKLVEAAHIQASAMVQFGQMAHVLPGASLPTPEGRAQYVGYTYSWLGENVAFNYPDANSVVTGWMNSPEHRANILNSNFTEIGVGVATDSQGRPYYCQVFGSPQ